MNHVGSFLGLAWFGKARHCRARNKKNFHGVVRHGIGRARRGREQGEARFGKAWLGVVRQGLERGVVRPGWAR